MKLIIVIFQFYFKIILKCDHKLLVVEVCFLLCFLKLLACNGFGWKSLRRGTSILMYLLWNRDLITFQRNNARNIFQTIAIQHSKLSIMMNFSVQVSIWNDSFPVHFNVCLDIYPCNKHLLLSRSHPRKTSAFINTEVTAVWAETVARSVQSLKFCFRFSGVSISYPNLSLQIRIFLLGLRVNNSSVRQLFSDYRWLNC